MANTHQEVAALLDLINTSVNKLAATHEHASRTLPSLNNAASPRSGGPILHNEMDAIVLAAACDQLKAAFVNPEQELLTLSFAHLLPAALGVAIEARVAEGLRQAPAEGIHVDELARPSGFDPQILARCLRLLADHHVFREVSLNNFAHTRLSLPLDTGKSIETLSKEPPEQVYAGTNGVTAVLALFCNETFRSSARLLDWLRSRRSQGPSTETDPHSDSPGRMAQTPFQLAFGTDKAIWEWFESHPDRQARFQAAMVGQGSIQSARDDKTSIVKGFPWDRLSGGGVVVDVGGGNGSALLPFFEAHPHLKFVMQDLPDVEPQFRTFWEKSKPDHFGTGRIEFQIHDFFSKNPISAAAVYHLQHIVHDWPDAEAIKILSRVAEAAGPASYIIITDFVAPVNATAPAAQSDCSPTEHAEIPNIEPLPAPLTTPTGQYGGVVHRFDLAMLVSLSGAERTADHWRSLLDEAGLRIVHVIPGDYSGGAQPGTLICVKK